MYTQYPRVFLGTSHDYGRIYLTPPSWSCGWYWSWGWIGNQRLHTHLNCLHPDENMYNAIKQYFRTFKLKKDTDLWVFCELVTTFYRLRESAELYHRGGSHYTTNPIKNLLQDSDQYNHINRVLIPAVFEETYKLFGQ